MKRWYFSSQPIGDESLWLSPVYAAIQGNNLDITEAVFDQIAGDCVKWEKVFRLAVNNRAVSLIEQLVNKCKLVSTDNDATHLRQLYSRMLCLILRERLHENDVVKLLVRVADVNYCEDSMTPLVAAAMIGDVDMCRLLVEYGALINCKSADTDPLVLAVTNCSVTAVKTLLTLGCQYQQNLVLNPTRRFLFHNQIQFSTSNCSMFHLAVMTGSVEMVKYLTEKHEVTEFFTDSCNNNPLHLAANLKMFMEMLLYCRKLGYDIASLLAQRNSDGKTPLQCKLEPILAEATSWSPNRKYIFLTASNVIQLFINSEVDFRQEPERSCAIALGFVIAGNFTHYLLDFIRLDFDVPAHINRRWLDDLTPALNPIMNAKKLLTPLELAIKSHKAAMVKLLINVGADACVVSNSGFTLLHYAALHCNQHFIAIADELTAAGANWNIVSQDYGSVVHTALSVHELKPYIIKYCVDKCGQVINSAGFFSVLELAALPMCHDEYKQPIMELLMMAGARMVPEALHRLVVYGRNHCHCDYWAAEQLVIGGCEVLPTCKLINRTVKHNLWFLVRMLLSCADSSTVSQSPYVTGVLSLSQPMNPVMEMLFHLATNPASLRHLARRVVRQQLFMQTDGASIIPAVFSLNCPISLKQYLLLDDTRRCDIDETPPHHCRFTIHCPQCIKLSKIGKSREVYCSHTMSNHADTEWDKYSNNADRRSVHRRVTEMFCTNGQEKKYDICYRVIDERSFDDD